MLMIFIGSDHAGEALMNSILDKLNVSFCFTPIIIDYKHDYVDIANLVCENIKSNLNHHLGILICGSGIGMSIVANRHKGIRAAVCLSEQTGKLSKEHNNANVLCLGSRIVSLDEQLNIVSTFLNTSFEGGRHLERINKIDTK